MMNTNRKFLISILAVFAMAAVMLFTESKSAGESGIIVKLELAPTIQEVEQLVAQYDEEHIAWLRLNTQLDFLFLLTYTAIFFFALKGLLERFSVTHNWRWVLAAASVAGVLDVAENIFILNFLNRDFSTPCFEIYYWCVHFKWILVVVFVIISLVHLGGLVYNRAFSKAG